MFVLLQFNNKLFLIITKILVYLVLLYLQIVSPFTAVWLVSISTSRIFLKSSVSTVHASQCFSATCNIGQFYSSNLYIPFL